MAASLTCLPPAPTCLQYLPASSTSLPPVPPCLQHLQPANAHTITAAIQSMRISLSSYLITLALPAFYSPSQTLYFTLRVPPIGIVHMLWLPPLPTLLRAPPRTADCTRLRRPHHYPARAPCLPHLPPAPAIAMRNPPAPVSRTCLPHLPPAPALKPARSCLVVGTSKPRPTTCAMPNHSTKPTFIALCSSMLAEACTAKP
jgi:hypothetical protein